MYEGGARVISQVFLDRMKDLLGEEYPLFERALTEGEEVKGIRVNRAKRKDGTIPKEWAERVTPIAYCDGGYILKDDVRIGQAPEHHAGIFYSQDPGAMSALCALDIEPDWWVLDTCAAPGGKASQAAEKLSSDGFILANEYVSKRAKIIVSNFERLGIPNALVTSMDTETLASLYPEVFDLVVTDAPCSGEGMFRKNDQSQENWSVENVIACAKRQSEILDNAAKAVKAGGYLLYSTCTYSLEENEEVVAEFLERHPDFTLHRVKDKLEEATRDGINIRGIDMSNARRFYPHASAGEGQFVALMKKAGESPKKTTFVYKDSTKPLDKKEREIVSRFFSESLVTPPKGRVAKVGDNIVLISHGCPIPPHSVYMAGVLVGEISGGILKPSHQFFSVFGDSFRIKEDLPQDKVEKYLLGEEIDTASSDKGWCCITYLGVPLGGGKMSSGRIKNHYPKGLRNK